MSGNKQRKPCLKLESCSKIKMILDKDIMDWQYAEAIRDVCARCNEYEEPK